MIVSGMKKILIVDDEADVEALVRQGFRKELRDGQYDIIFASDGREALDLIVADHDIGVVVSDINMPRMDGLTLLSHVVDIERPMVTVMVTAYGDMGKIRKAMNRGAFDFLTKPIDFADFRMTLKNAVTYADRLIRIEADKDEALRKEAVLARHFSPGIASELASQRTSAPIIGVGERKEATFMFTDIQGFAGLMEALPAEEVVSLLNCYFEGVLSRIFDHSGTVMKIIGDSVHAIFGAPLKDDNHARLGLECAQAIDVFAREFRAERISKSVPIGETRIGIHSGSAVFGNTGSERFFDYSAYGDPVNVASRLEQANKLFATALCLSEATVSQIPGFRGRKIGKLILRGREAAIQAFEPATPEQMSDAHLKDYNEAYKLMTAGDTRAQTAFARLLIDRPDDPLCAFHLRRMLSGTCRDTITV